MRPLPLIIAAALVVAACGGGNEEDDVREAIDGFVRATNERDFGRVCESFDARTRRGLSRGDRTCAQRIRSAAGGEREAISIEVKDVNVDGDRASVRADLGAGGRTQQRNQTLRLAREGGVWKLRFTPEPG